jgi:hypothetical protein
VPLDFQISHDATNPVSAPAAGLVLGGVESRNLILVCGRLSAGAVRTRDEVSVHKVGVGFYFPVVQTASHYLFSQIEQSTSYLEQSISRLYTSIPALQALQLISKPNPISIVSYTSGSLNYLATKLPPPASLSNHHTCTSASDISYEAKPSTRSPVDPNINL